jgi:hypothetical protein
MQAVVAMLQSNRVIRRISLSKDERNDQIYQESILPLLQANIYRPRVRRIQQTSRPSLREGLLGRALYAVRNQRDLVRMLLLKNVEILTTSKRDARHNSTSGARKRKGHRL